MQKINVKNLQFELYASNPSKLYVSFETEQAFTNDALQKAVRSVMPFELSQHISDIEISSELTCNGHNCTAFVYLDFPSETAMQSLFPQYQPFVNQGRFLGDCTLHFTQYITY